MVFNRMLQIECKQADKCDAAGELMLFAQASSQAEKVGKGVWRSRGGSYKRPICVSYEGEGGVDQGGLYRDFLDAVSSELMSTHLPILIRTPNNQSNAGECRDAWSLSPAPISAATRRMLHFLGKLMAICVRG